MKTFLQVPYREKEAAKALGARFDMAERRWYVPDGIDLSPFLKWVPNMPDLSRAIRKTLRKKV